MIDQKFSEFVAIFNERVQAAKLGEPGLDGVLPVRPREIVIGEIFVGDLVDHGHFGDVEQVYLDKKVGRYRCRLHGYAIREEDSQVDLLTVIPAQTPDGDLESVGKTAIETAVKQAAQVFRYVNEDSGRAMEPSSESLDMVRALGSVVGSVQRVRIIVVTDGRFTGAPLVIEVPDCPPVDVDLWDIERLFRATASGQTYESFEIDLRDLLGHALPCLRAPATSNDHQCYLAVLPGQLLHDLYHTHGPRLLELNVRSFLQARGKVNRGIRDTLSHHPEYFMAYNNGLSVTVEEIVLDDEALDAPRIRAVRGLQIVNGGQTVASIHRAGSRDKVDLSQVFVQAKITRVCPDDVDNLVPYISRYSNTQNKVQETDFSANHPFHVRIQQLSRSVWTPGETSRWFYERARGQWEVARNREGTTPARKRAFDQREPRSQKFDKTMLAKSANTWDKLPHIVSRGGQKNFVDFMKRLADFGATWEPEESYFKRLVAKIIVFKRAERIARQIGFAAYRANAVSYTIALLSYRTSGRIDLDEIWKRQEISRAVEATMKTWMPLVHTEIVESSAGRNVTEWCKKAECWTHLQSLDLPVPQDLQDELAEGLPLPNVGHYSESKTTAPRSLSNEERDRQALTMKYSVAEWSDILEWAAKSGEFSQFELGIGSSVYGYALGGWQKVPSPKQTKHTVKIIRKWEEEVSLAEAERD